MNRDLPDEAVAFGEAADAAFASIGGIDAARRCEDGRDRSEITGVLDRLGVDDLDPRVDLDTACAAAELCRIGGRVMLPYPLVARLLTADGLPLTIVSNGRLRVDHGDVFGQWRAVSLDGSTVPRHGRDVSERDSARSSPTWKQATRVAATSDVDLHLTLTAWVILGVLERSLELAVGHVTERVQFGQPLSKFQTVQFQLADVSVAIDGLRELCRYTLWRVQTGSESARADALALRWYALDSAAQVLRTTQQLHGASGLCDEYDISILCRHVQPLLRLPMGVERTTAALADAIAEHGWR